MAMLSPSPFERLPNEILSSLLLEVKVTSGAYSFLQCLLCCKTWHDMGLPILYRDVLLTDLNLGAFVRCYKALHGPLLRSLTVTIDPVQPAKTDRDEQRLNRYGSRNSNALWHLLQQLPGKISSMVKMTTFSLTVSTKTYARGFWIPRSTIATIIKALPEACVNVEIDTKDYDEPAPRTVHLCDDLRAILPRLQHLRLCLTMMCPAIFMSGYSAFDSSEFRSQLKPVVAPFLETLIVSCLPGSILATGQAGLCDPGWTPGWTFDWRDYISDSEELAATIVNAICLLKDTNSFPVAERISVLHAGGQGLYASGQGLSACLNRRNVLEASTWAMPFGPIAIDQTDRFFIRLPEDQELVSDQWTIKALAEGETWIETMNGCRLPFSVIAKKPSAYAKKDLFFVDAKHWKGSNPRISCALWCKERAWRTRLVEAEYRDGLSDMRPVGERILSR